MIQVLNIMYIFIHLCDNLQITAICYFYYEVWWFCFWGCELSTKHVVAHPLYLSLFPPGVKVLATIGSLLPCFLLRDLMKWCICTCSYEFSSVVICNYLEYMYFKYVMSRITSHSSNSVRPWADHLLDLIVCK